MTGPAGRGGANLGVAVLGVALVLLIGVVGLELRPVTRDDTVMRDIPTSAAGPRQAVAAGGVAVAAADRQAAWVDTILARPLFAPNRRPSAVAPVVAGKEAPGLPRIAGIMVDGNRRSVIFAAAVGERPIVAAEGADVNGFKVQMIEANQVTVVGPGGTQVLHPSFDANRVVPSAPAPQAQGIPGLPNLQLNGAGLPGIPGLPVAPSGAPPGAPPGASAR